MASTLFCRRECVVYVAATGDKIKEQKDKENESSLFVAVEDEVDAKIKTLEEGEKCKKGSCKKKDKAEFSA